MRRRMLRAATAAGMLAVLAGLTWGSAANAETPPSLDPGHISDHADVLSDADEARLEQRLEELAAADGLPELFVVLVPDFESPDNALAWADDTALRNNLAPDQYLLAIATEGRSLALSAEYGGDGVAAGPLSESRILEIEDRLGSVYLSDDDWAGGIGYVADEFSTVPLPWWVWVLGLVVLALIVFAVTRLVIFLRRRAALAAELRTLEGQKKRTAQRLVEADEAVRTSEQELGFVTAEFGDDVTADFTAVLAETRARLQQGFQILEKLQDAEEDTPQETRSWTDEILRLCTEIDAALDARKKEIASLRALADGAADNLARLRAARADAALLQSETADRLASLAAAFPPADLVGVATNADEIGARLRAADQQLDALQKAADARKPRAVAQAVHEIERLLAEVKELHDAVDAQADALASRANPSAESSTAPQDAAASSPPEGPALTGTGSILEQATAAMRAAEKSVQARPGEVGSFPLMRLSSAQRQLAMAVEAAGTENGDLHAKAALTAAQQVLALVTAPAAPERARFVRPARSTSSEAVMYDSSPDGDSQWRRTTSYADADDEGRGGKAVIGGLSGGAVGFFGGLGVASEEPGVIVLFVLGGAALGALSGAFGGDGSSGGGSSSGWGGSRSSGGWSSGGSRSSSRSGGRSFGGGSRSSGRSGGRRF